MQKKKIFGFLSAVAIVTFMFSLFGTIKVLADDGDTPPIPASRRIENMVDCLSAANIDLDDDELAAIDSATFSRNYSMPRRIRGFIGRTARRAMAAVFNYTQPA